MVVPEQHHALGERLVGDQHLLDPPVAQLAALLLQRPLGGLQRLAVDAGFFFASAASARAACCWRRSSAGPSFSQPGGGVMASRRTLASSRSTVAA